MTSASTPPNDESVPGDLELLRRYARTGDEEAFVQIVRRYADAVYAACWRVLRERSRAEEAAQEAFLKLVRHRNEVKQSLGGWLHRTATLVAIDMLRRDISRRKRERSYADEQARAADDEPPAWRELSPVIDQALAELPDDQRDLLVAHFLAGRTQREIAAERAVSAPTLSRRMSEAVAALRDRLQHRGVSLSVVLLLSLLERPPSVSASGPLRAELGKIALASGAVVGSTASIVWLASHFRTLLLLSLIAVLLGISGWIVVRTPSWTTNPPAGPATPQAAPHTGTGENETRGDAARGSAASETDAAAAGEADGIGFFVLDDLPPDPPAGRIVMFQDPATASDERLIVVLGDQRTATLPLEEARTRIEQQTGQPLDELITTLPKRQAGDITAP